MAKTAATTARPRKAVVTSRRDQLLDEAARQLNARGVSLTSLTDLADKLKVSRAALYYYVDDREDLVFQVYRRSCEILARHLGEAARSGRPTLSVIESFVSNTLDENGTEIASLSELGLLRPAERETVLGLYEGVVARLASLLESGAQSGEVRPCDFNIVARTIISIIHWAPLASRWTFYVDPPLPRAAIVGAIIRLLQEGWAADRAAPVDPPQIDFEPLLFREIAAFDRGRLGEAKRETILATASRLFNRKGVDTTSLDEIAAELGATKRTLYHYVGDKQTIVSACYERAERITAHIHAQAEVGGGAKADKLLGILRAAAVAQQREDLEPLRPVAGFDALSPEDQVTWASRSREISRTYKVLFEQAQELGTMRADLDVRFLMLIMPGEGAWLAKGLVQGDMARKAQIAAEAVNVLRLGLKPIGQ